MQRQAACEEPNHHAGSDDSRLAQPADARNPTEEVDPVVSNYSQRQNPDHERGCRVRLLGPSSGQASRHTKDCSGCDQREQPAQESPLLNVECGAEYQPGFFKLLRCPPQEDKPKDPEARPHQSLD